MKFTYKSYEELIKKINNKGYQFSDYTNWTQYDKSVILRHDVDYDLNQAAILSDLEKKIELEINVCLNPTYYILLSTNFYNVHSLYCRSILKKIIENGGQIGLHFDVMQYIIDDDLEYDKQIIEKIIHEKKILESIIEKKIDSVSFHRPVEKILQKRIYIPDMINSYDDTFFKEMKYVSDSRMMWHENIDDYIEKTKYNRLHILTHPFWYHEEDELLHDVLFCACEKAKRNYYCELDSNIKNLSQELRKDEICNNRLRQDIS